MVNDLFKEGLKLRDINVVSAERKTWNNPEGQSENIPRRKYPDIIIVKLSSKGDSDKVLKSKANVRKSATYKEVFVEPERSRDERIHLANMRPTFACTAETPTGLIPPSLSVTIIFTAIKSLKDLFRL